MLSMTAAAAGTQPVYAGIDTHKDTHHVAVVDAGGARISDRQFASGTAGDAAMIDWLHAWPVERIAVEQTGTYGAGLTRSLQAAGYRVAELNAPDLTVRARAGKSDPIDAYMAADAARSGRAASSPKDRTGIVESIRYLSAARDSAVKARSAALNQMRDLAVIAPNSLRERFGPTPTTGHLVTIALAWRADRSALADPVQAAKHAMRTVAARIRDLSTEIRAFDTQLDALTATAAPRLRDRPQVGPHIAAQLLCTLGQCPDRITTDAQFARLCGVAPIPASSGKTTRMRLHRGGDRQANRAIHLVAIGRLRHHPPAIAYRDRRSHDNMTDKDIIRAMKRHIARELFGALKADLTALAHPHHTHP